MYSAFSKKIGGISALRSHPVGSVTWVDQKDATVFSKGIFTSPPLLRDKTPRNIKRAAIPFALPIEVKMNRICLLPGTM